MSESPKYKSTVIFKKTAFLLFVVIVVLLFWGWQSIAVIW